MKEIIKDPDAELDYLFDWSDWLVDGDTISVKAVIPEIGITVKSSEIVDVNTAVVVWLSGGTVGRGYNVVCRITTAAGRIDDRTLRAIVKQR